MRRREFVKIAGLFTAGELLAKKIPVEVERHKTSVTDPVTGLTLEAEWVGQVTGVTATTITIRYGSPHTMDLNGAISFDAAQHPFRPGDHIRFRNATRRWVGA